MTHPVCHDVARLHPAFRARVIDDVGADMTAKGWPWRVWETARSPERGEWLEATGKSRNGKLSIHCYQDDKGQVGAVDIIHAELMWFVPEKGASKERKDFLKAERKRFVQDLQESAARHGLYTIDWDGWHLQCVPVTLKAQNAYRALTPKARGEFIQRVCG